MAGTINGPPDLQEILATLATFAPQSQPAATSPSHDLAADFIPLSDEPKAQDPRLRPQSRSGVASKPASPKPQIDPATITTWQEGLRCVTKIAAQNAQFAASIRKMMDNQRQNEMRWYAERQALKQSQGSRERASAQATSILQGLGGGSGPDSATAANGSGSDLTAELATFDRKIYSAQLQMEDAMTAELKGLGVPFFGTDGEAIVGDDMEQQDIVHQSRKRPKHSPLIRQWQIQELRGRMVEHLEALYRD